MTPPTRYALVPVEATAENGLKYALIGEFEEPFTYTVEGGDELTVHVPISWTSIKCIYSKAIAASPNAGCVTAQQLEVATEAHWANMMEDWDHPTAWNEMDAEHKAERVGSMRAALTALGLAVSDETQRGEAVDG